MSKQNKNTDSVSYLLNVSVSYLVFNRNSANILGRIKSECFGVIVMTNLNLFLSQK